MIQTIDTIDMYDGTLINVRFHLVRNNYHRPYIESHGVTYLNARNQLSNGNNMGLDLKIKEGEKNDRQESLR